MKKHRRGKLPNTVTIDSIYEKKFLSLSSVIEGVVIDAFILPGVMRAYKWFVEYEIFFWSPLKSIYNCMDNSFVYLTCIKRREFSFRSYELAQTVIVFRCYWKIFKIVISTQRNWAYFGQWLIQVQEGHRLDF